MEIRAHSYHPAERGSSHISSWESTSHTLEPTLCFSILCQGGFASTGSPRVGAGGRRAARSTLCPGVTSAGSSLQPPRLLCASTCVAAGHQERHCWGRRVHPGMEIKGADDAWWYSSCGNMLLILTDHTLMKCVFCKED